MSKSPIEEARQEFIEASGNCSKSLGSGRTLGQIYAYLYLSQTPKSLDDISEALSISKGSASTIVRQLENWGAVHRSWIQGDRKDYYQAKDEFGKILRKALLELIGQHIHTADEFLEGAEALINAPDVTEQTAEEELAFFKTQIDKLVRFRTRVQKAWDNPLISLLLK